ncbi:MAG: type I-C CRISPR-associated protein Cas5c [Selenomonadaceae bacterium]
MSFGTRIECWGSYACFTRPEMKVERVSYDIMTPSAARGIAEAIFWHPGLRYVIDAIYLLAPIRFANVRRNEVSSKISANTVKDMAKKQKSMYISTADDIAQRAATVLRDVHYVIELHFEMTDKANASDNPGKFADMLRRRARKGQCYHQPYFGTREFPARFRLMEDNETINPYPETRDLGYMLYDMDYSDSENIEPNFFHARLVNGVMDLREVEVRR